jgi:hypothetical protein
MVLESCPLTEELHKYRRKKIGSEFPVLSTSSNECYLSLWKYFTHVPERFQSKKACQDIFKHLNDLKDNEPSTLIKILKDYEKLLSIAFKSLDEVNSLPFHDMLLPANHYELMQFYENHLHPTYLKLTEGIFANLILPFSAYYRINRNVRLEGFDVYNRVEELDNTQYEYLSYHYDNTIRNAIAHGNVTYRGNDIIYEDKRGNSITLIPLNVVNLFDGMLDVCNGLSLGFRLFYFTNLDFIENHGIAVPLPVMLEELRAETEAPGWETMGCLESETTDNKSQLVIFTRNLLLDRLKLYYYVFRSAYLAERFTPGYERYFFALDSKYSLSGWAAFDGSELNRLRVLGNSEMPDYANALENGLIFFNPKLKLPRFIFKISTLLSIMKIIIPTKWGEFKEAGYPLSVDPRDLLIHRNKFHSVIRGSIVVKSNSSISIDNLIRTHCKSILRKAIRTARKRENITNISKYLRLGYLRVGIYSDDFRIRKLRNSGLIPELLCTIEFKRLRRVNTIDIIGGTPETIKNCRIVWNQNSEIGEHVGLH